MRELDFADYNEKLSKSGRETLALAIEESRRRGQNYLDAGHLFIAAAKIEAQALEKSILELGLNPKSVLKDIEDHVDRSKKYGGQGLKITFSMKTIFKLAFSHSSQSGRSNIEARDLLMAIFAEENNVPIEVFRAKGVGPDKVRSTLGYHFEGVRSKEGAPDLPGRHTYVFATPMGIMAGIVLLLLVIFLLVMFLSG
ncbi:MAG TPA: Clp protease N-terminal domain-containing protein [Acidobacteriota bacterium]|nr:Clp protease N-terminal domain-containing protein [Acidobacteriota bacterium]